MALQQLEIRKLDKAVVTFFKSNGSTIALGRFEPGWKWSENAKPVAKTELCEISHSGYCVAGNVTVRTSDGNEIHLKKGDVYHIPAGHDAWVTGVEPCEMIDFIGAKSLEQDWQEKPSNRK